MDVTFNGDYSCIRNGESAENMAVLRFHCPSLLKSSLHQKRFHATMDNDFLFHLITQLRRSCWGDHHFNPRLLNRDFR
jgi:hypothetical protein